MMEFIKIVGWIVASINSLASIILLCVICPRFINNENLGFDYMGVIVAILSLLVTLLVAWQIFQTIDLRKKVDSVDDKLKDSREDYDHEISGALYHVYATNYMLDKQYNNALECLISGIKEQNECSNPVYLKNIITTMYVKFDKFSFQSKQGIKELIELLEKAKCKDGEANKYRIQIIDKLKLKI